ncbi:2TM domain-containing protein [uncultured Polaribacter sp.]|uniref:2TM domain-containing protein n=1 Tax=uncultured Polaribacter sp. TaxID=174711 RepID=UPI00262B5576|nr:2TM domain-containing protein [uncultured Polaribacter sp.]
MEIRNEDYKYILVKKRVEKIAKFYKHFLIYLVINTILSAVFIVGDINDGDTFNEAFFNYGNYKIWFFWGIAIAFQAFNVFGLSLFLSKDWEERKLKQYMKE